MPPDCEYICRCKNLSCPDCNYALVMDHEFWRIVAISYTDCEIGDLQYESEKDKYYNEYDYEG